MKNELFDFNYKHLWPKQNEFPINNETHERTIKSIIIPDVENSSNYLIVTGFTSLANLVEIFGAVEFPNLKKLRIVLGFEPDIFQRKKWPNYELSNEVKNYWLKKGISIIHGGAVLNLIEKINNQAIEFRLMDKLHAKIYVGDTHSILGSANFSKNGITKQQEANVRVSRSGDSKEKHQYESFKQIAENFFDLADSYNTSLIDLLHKLLKDVTWQEALARSVAEIIEGEWLNDYKDIYQAIMSTELWPTQRMGIAKAMYIIQNQGNVLIADPTGSGKTKLSIALAYTVYHWLIENGKRDSSSAVIIAPKQILDNWEKEQNHFRLFHNIKSMGLLSTGKGKKQMQIQKDIERTSILIIDEAHNYLNKKSNRSKLIMRRNGSAHVILSTATPINKKADDLLRLIELLDIDNLSDADLEEYMRLRTAKTKNYNEAYLNKLKGYINQFIVRRTKKRLNDLISKEPSKYKNNENKQCRYPKTVPEIYQTGETETDKKLALEISNLVGQLKGVNFLQTIKLPEYFPTEEEEVLKYIKQRVSSAPALAAYMVKSSLRSSRCALMEYLKGSDFAMKFYELSSSKSKTGNIIDRIAKQRNQLPKVFHIKRELLPSWLINIDEYQRVCDEELSIYNQIVARLEKISDAREKAKSKLLKDKAEQYGKLLAFDSTVITLDYLKKLLDKSTKNIDIIVATGQNERSKELVKQVYGHGSMKNKTSIALCSDAMSEGVNLQDGNALVLLDTPSVLRLIEQRIGRLERMDSEHEKIYVYWPDDSESFSLNGDKKIIDLLAVTDNLIGNNVEIPSELYNKYLHKDIGVKNYIKTFEEYTSNEYEWDGISDTFQLLHELVDGEKSIIPTGIYDSIKDVESTIKTRVSFIKSDTSWSFFAFRGDASRSPKWCFIDEHNNTYTDFTQISELLRKCLTVANVVQMKWTSETNDYLQKTIINLRQHEIEMLPFKKKRALNVAKEILKYNFKRETDLERKTYINRLSGLLEMNGKDEISVDYGYLAELWLEVLQPVLDKKRKEQVRQKKVFSLKDLHPKDIALDIETLKNIWDNCQYTATLDEMIAACIICFK